jgi:hypothetical protein
MRYVYTISPYFGEPFEVEGVKITNANSAYTIYDNFPERRPGMPFTQYTRWTAPHHSVKEIHGQPILEVQG